MSKMRSLDIREFVVAWQASDTIDEVKKLLGVEEADNAALSTKATQLRAKGVQMKRMRQPLRYDYDLLNELAAYAKEESERNPDVSPETVVSRFLQGRNGQQ